MLPPKRWLPTAHLAGHSCIVPPILSLLVCGTWHIVSVISMCFQISKATVSERLSDSPCALVAGLFGWTGNMERLAVSNAHQKTDDPQRSYYLNQKKTLEINPRHPLIKELLRRVQDDASDPTAKDIALMMFRTGMSLWFLETQDRLFRNAVVFDLKRVTEVFMKCFCSWHYH